MTQEIYKSALHWLGGNFHILPIQPNTKKHVAGFGLYQNQITNMQQARDYFLYSQHNIAVACLENNFIVDFDEWHIYTEWLKVAKQIDEQATTSYTELTPSGGTHVFMCGDISGMEFIDKVEIKKTCLVAPSKINNKYYEVFCNSQIYKGDVKKILSPLSKPIQPAPVHTKVQPPNFSTSKIQKIKESWSIEHLFKKHFPNITLKQRGKYLTGFCPFHPEKEASFFIDIDIKIFGCHACKKRGDVINFFALLNNITNEQAIEKMQ